MGQIKGGFNAWVEMRGQVGPYQAETSSVRKLNFLSWPEAGGIPRKASVEEMGIGDI